MCGARRPPCPPRSARTRGGAAPLPGVPPLELRPSRCGGRGAPAPPAARPEPRGAPRPPEEARHAGAAAAPFRPAPHRSAPLRARQRGRADEAPHGGTADPRAEGRAGPEPLRREPGSAGGGGTSSPRGGVSAPGQGGAAAGGAERRHWPAAAVMSPI
ncbi:unnamed protein product [Coccothraustes coccothraustes]